MPVSYRLHLPALFVPVVDWQWQFLNLVYRVTCYDTSAVFQLQTQSCNRWRHAPLEWLRCPSPPRLAVTWLAMACEPTDLWRRDLLRMKTWDRHCSERHIRICLRPIPRFVGSATNLSPATHARTHTHTLCQWRGNHFSFFFIFITKNSSITSIILSRCVLYMDHWTETQINTQKFVLKSSQNMRVFHSTNAKKNNWRVCPQLHLKSRQSQQTK